jgi:AcrR family transcriptional regulator
MTVDTSARKPANRPSRRHYLIDAAVELFSLEPWEFITVADIVERAGMTPATFYYHFSSREQLLEEIVQDFAQKWIDMVERLLAAADTPDALSDVAGQLLDEIDESGPVAKIFFLSTEKEPLLAERIRTDARKRLIRSATKAVRRLDPSRDRARAHVNGVAMIVLYEMAARSHLGLADAYRTLGPRRFRIELAKLSRVSTGFADTAEPIDISRGRARAKTAPPSPSRNDPAEPQP